MEKCPICLDYIEGKYKKFDCECNYFYHKQCYDDLTLNDVRCCICRKEPDCPFEIKIAFFMLYGTIMFFSHMYRQTSNKKMKYLLLVIWLLITIIISPFCILLLMTIMATKMICNDIYFYYKKLINLMT